MDRVTSQSPDTPNLNFIVSGQELFDKKIDSIPCLVEPIFPKVGVVAIGGSSDTGKSSFLRQLASSIAMNKPSFLGFKINAEHKKVIYVSTEDDETAIAFLIRKQNPQLITSEVLNGMGFIFDTTKIVEKLHMTLQKHNVDCIIIDAFTDIFGGDLNQSNIVRNYLQKFHLIAEKYKCLVIFLHHTGKKTENNEPSKNNLLGSQGFEAKMRMVIELRRDLINPTLRHLCIVKGNYLPEDYKNRSFVLRFDNNLFFTNTGTRTPFEQLARPRPDNHQRDELRNQVLAYHDEGLSLNDITRRLEELGLHVARSTAHNWIQNNQNNPTGYGYANDEEGISEQEENEEFPE